MEETTTKKITVLKRLLSVIAAAALVIPLSGCSLFACEPESDPLTVCTIRGVHAYYPNYTLANPVVAEKITEAFFSNGRAIDIIVDGAPYIVANCTAPDRGDGYSTSKRTEFARRDTSSYFSICSDWKAQSPESDLLAALTLASQALGASETENKLLIIEDSGLSTIGLLDFTREDLIDNDPGEIVTKLTELNEIPDLTGVEVLWFGQGQVTGDQAKLTGQYRAKLRMMWDAVLNASGASEIRYDDTPFAGEAPQDVPDCTLIDIPEVALDLAAIQKPLKLEEVRFKPDSAELLDENEAVEALMPLAKLLRDNDISITLLGTTASYGNQSSCIELSHKRAETVKRLMIDKLGVDCEIICLGIGYLDSPLKNEDLDSNGDLIAEAAKSNRAVYVYDSQCALADEIREIAEKAV